MWYIRIRVPKEESGERRIRMDAANFVSFFKNDWIRMICIDSIVKTIISRLSQR